MIPKTIHYCWFGGNDKPKLVKKCIQSWYKFCPGFRIIEWNDNNFDLSSAPLFVRQAASMKKWAFVTDYVRLRIIYEQGGVYLDTDVELLKPLDPFLSERAYFGFEFTNGIATGLGFGAERKCEILKDLMASYETTSFIQEDGLIDSTVCVKKDTAVFMGYGLILNNQEQILDNGIHIYPSDYFCPGRWKGIMNVTDNTVSIHWYASTWYDEKGKRNAKKSRRKELKVHIMHFPNRLGIKILGHKKYEQLKKVLKGKQDG